MLNLNIGGLSTKLVSKDFVDYLSKFDVICFTETFVDAGFSVSVLKDFNVYVAPAKKLSKQGRRSGGVVVLLRKCFVHFCTEIKVKYDNFIVLEMSHKLFQTDRPVLMIFMYAPPRDSPAYAREEDGIGMELLENCLIELYEAKEQFYLLMCGDFNARTGQENGRGMSDGLTGSGEEEIVFERSAKDLSFNSFGTHLLSLCTVLNCSILNGIKEFNLDDSETYVSQTGSSTIDYFILSNDLCKSDFICALTVEDSCVESDHLPVALTVRLPTGGPSRNIEKVYWTEKVVWDEQKVPEFIEVLQSPLIQDRLKRAKTIVSSDINKALEELIGCLQTASKCMIKKIKIGGSRNKTQWFDRECFEKRKHTRSKLRQYRRTREMADRQSYVEVRREYRMLLKEKKRAFKASKAKYLADNLNDPKLFWNELKSCLGLGNKSGVSNKITLEEWHDHFKSVFSPGDAEARDEGDNNTEGEHRIVDILDQPISEEEVVKSVRKLKSGKASGLDNVIAEMLKSACGIITPFLTDYFNEIFKKGLYPDLWSKAIIVPIHKKGNLDTTDNYRGVSLLSLIGKCYTSILNRRLYDWLEDNQKISESQAGFRQGYTTTDHIFTLYAVTQKYLSKKGSKLYVAFVDLKKAFDSVRRHVLIKMLSNAGVSSKFICAIKAIYEQVFSSVRVNSFMTEMFECPIGLRQGCVLSPTLFSIVINEIATRMAEEGKHGVQMLPGLIELFILLFADDLALMSSTPHGLQVQIDCVHRVCEELGLTVNIDKTKVMVFRKGGFLGQHEKWFIDGKRLEVVNKYVYLGYTFTTTMSPFEGVKQLAVKGKKALFDVIRVHNQLDQMTIKTFFKIFDSKIQPIVLYAAEMWGVSEAHSIVERVHLTACKRVLNVAPRTPNKMVYGELGRYPLYINCYIRAVKYWFRVLHMDAERLPNQAYRMLMNLDSLGKENWVSKIRAILQSLGFGYVWTFQGVAREGDFLCIMKQRLKDVFCQDWTAGINTSERFNQYSLFKTSFGLEKYLQTIQQKCFRDTVVRVRFGISDLKTHKNRYTTAGTLIDNKCPFCPELEENELHLCFRCPRYDAIRPTFLKDIPDYLEVAKFTSLMSTDNEKIIRQIAWFFFKAFEIRSKEISSPI